MAYHSEVIMNKNQHDFDIKLGLTPCDGNTHIKMDGKELKCVSSLVMRAGVDGYTNVVMQFDAPVVARVVAELTANISVEEELVEVWFATALDKALVRLEQKQGECVDFPIKDRYTRAQLTACLLETVIEGSLIPLDT